MRYCHKYGICQKRQFEGICIDCAPSDEEDRIVPEKKTKTKPPRLPKNIGDFDVFAG